MRESRQRWPGRDPGEREPSGAGVSLWTLERPRAGAGNRMSRKERQKGAVSHSPSLCTAESGEEVEESGTEQ